MPGPPPKNPRTRQRRNRSATQSTLIRTRPPRQRAPSLPKRTEGAWHLLTRAWWRDVWRSPMAVEFLEADKHALFRLAMLVDMFWEHPSKELAAEIRLEQQAFGLTPIDRRRLQWTVAEEEERRRVRSTAPPPPAEADVDPRAALKVVAR